MVSLHASACGVEATLPKPRRITTHLLRDVQHLLLPSTMPLRHNTNDLTSAPGFLGAAARFWQVRQFNLQFELVADMCAALLRFRLCRSCDIGQRIHRGVYAFCGASGRPH